MSETFPRRRFLLHLLIIGGIALLSDATRGGDQPANQHQEWIAVGPAEKFPVGRFKRVVLPAPAHGDIAYIKRMEGETFLALSGRCTHKGCLVDWDGKRQQFLCPCHQGVYDAIGHNISGPPPGPLSIMNTKVDERGTLSVRRSS